MLKVENAETKIVLNNWKMKYREYDEFECEAPCSLYSVLLKNNIIEDPYVGTNEQKYVHISDYDVSFCTEFTLTEQILSQKHVNLVFGGIDTLSEIFLNGKQLLKTNNMHRKYVVDIKPYAHFGKNVLKVDIKSPTKYMDKMYAEKPIWSVDFVHKGQPYLRKALHMGGWDWGPKMFDMGIWKPVYIEAYSDSRIEDVEIRQIHENENVTLKISVDISEPENDNEIIAEFEGERYKLENNCGEIKVKNPKLWWPNGLGEQPLYTLNVKVEKSGQVIAETEKRIGLRTMTVSRDYDEWGREFCFKVNGKKIFAKGANYIPEKNILSELCFEETYKLLDNCKKANFNCIRVWGGGYYPDDYFFDLCDEMGIIVWQDFMFACMDVSLSGDLEESISQEATQQVRRIRHHASLGVLCGNNEIEESFKFWGRPFPNNEFIESYNRIFCEILPEICEELVPDVFYWPSSPSADCNFDHSHSQEDGDNHVWWQWHNGSALDALKLDFSRFCSEFGLQSFPSMDVLEKYISEKQMRLFTDEMNNHQKGTYMGTAKILRYIGEQYGLPGTIEEIVFASQICQSEGVRYTVEHYRRNRNRCMGALYWQLNDIWPAISWSSIDCFGKWKPLHYAAKRFYEPIHLSAFINEEKLMINVSNETLEEFKGKVVVNIKNMDLDVISTKEYDVSVDELSAESIGEVKTLKMSDIALDEIFAECVLYNTRDEKISDCVIVFETPAKLKLKPVKIEVDIKKKGDIAEINLCANKFVHNVFVDISGESAPITNNYFSITSKEPVTLKVKTDFDEKQLRSRIVVKNDLDILAPNI